MLLAGLRKDVATYHVEEYSMATNTWVDRAPLLSATFRTAGAYVNGAVYVFGGDPVCGCGGHHHDEHGENEDEEGEHGEHEEEEDEHEDEDEHEEHAEEDEHEHGEHEEHEHAHEECVESDILQVYFDTEHPNIFVA